ncbi:methionine adenosyltransferase [Eggerthella sp. YY7918]|uniref:methionine adenosyltransferase n=1 Tax=Eggerthella sp. (strain YY7918) TaxID=502558 RepID=UPI001563856C
MSQGGPADIDEGGTAVSNATSSYLFTSESVTEGHPDKVCDQISDAILDAILAKEIELAAQGYIAPDGHPADPAQVRVACETMAMTGMVIVTGEIRTQAYVDVPAIVREVLREIGYDRAKYGFDCDTCGVLNAIHDQSPDIAQGVDESWEAQHGLAAEDDPYERVGAGDQGMMFGYACDETPTLMPLPIYLAHRLAERLTEVRKDETMPALRPDGKTQVSVRYENDRPVHVEKVVVSTQHAEDIEHEALRAQIIANVVEPVLAREGVSLAPDAEIHVNPTGRFVIGGPMGDAGLTGRKIIVDTYGGMGRHGGGAFSGKDCTKVDRSAAYAARWVAKNVVAAGLAHRCEVQVAYAIGMAKPVSVMIDTFGTNAVPETDIQAAIDAVFDLRPGAIIDELDLRRPIYQKTAAYGHFGRELPEFTWEQTNKADALRKACGLV